MKKRKPPIILITIIVAMLGIVAWTSFPKDAKNPDDPLDTASQENKDDSVVSEDKFNLDKDTFQKIASVDSNKSAAAKEKVPEKVRAARGYLIQKPVWRQPKKPVPDEQAIVGQWYDEDSTKTLTPGKK